MAEEGEIMEDGEIDEEVKEDSGFGGSGGRRRIKKEDSEDIHDFLEKKRQDLHERVKTQLRLVGVEAKVDSGEDSDDAGGSVFNSGPGRKLGGKHSSPRQASAKAKPSPVMAKYHDLDRTEDPTETMMKNWAKGSKGRPSATKSQRPKPVLQKLASSSQDESDSGFDPMDDYYGRSSPTLDQPAGDKDYRVDVDFRNNRGDYSRNGPRGSACEDEEEGSLREDDCGMDAGRPGHNEFGDIDERSSRRDGDERNGSGYHRGDPSSEHKRGRHGFGDSGSDNESDCGEFDRNRRGSTTRRGGYQSGSRGSRGGSLERGGPRGGSRGAAGAYQRRPWNREPSTSTGRRGGGVEYGASDRGGRGGGDRAKTIPCKFFRDGYCREGSNCNFSHDGESGNNNTTNNSASGPGPSPSSGSGRFNRDSNKRPEVCRFYARGFCRSGANCAFLHHDYPCVDYHLRQNCSKGEDCVYSHEPLNNFTQPIIDKVKANDRYRAQPYGIRKTDGGSASSSGATGEGSYYRRRRNSDGDHQQDSSDHETGWGSGGEGGDKGGPSTSSAGGNRTAGGWFGGNSPAGCSDTAANPRQDYSRNSGSAGGRYSLRRHNSGGSGDNMGDYSSGNNDNYNNNNNNKVNSGADYEEYPHHYSAEPVLHLNRTKKSGRNNDSGGSPIVTLINPGESKRKTGLLGLAPPNVPPVFGPNAPGSTDGSSSVHGGLSPHQMAGDQGFYNQHQVGHGTGGMNSTSNSLLPTPVGFGQGTPPHGYCTTGSAEGRQPMLGSSPNSAQRGDNAQSLSLFGGNNPSYNQSPRMDTSEPDQNYNTVGGSGQGVKEEPTQVESTTSKCAEFGGYSAGIGGGSMFGAPVPSSLPPVQQQLFRRIQAQQKAQMAVNASGAVASNGKQDGDKDERERDSEGMKVKQEEEDEQKDEKPEKQRTFDIAAVLRQIRANVSQPAAAPASADASNSTSDKLPSKVKEEATSSPRSGEPSTGGSDCYRPPVKVELSSAPTSPIEESPASPEPQPAPISPGSVPRIPDRPKRKVKWILIPVDVRPAVDQGVPQRVIQASLTDTRLRNDPRVKKRLTSQFDAVSHLISAGVDSSSDDFGSPNGGQSPKMSTSSVGSLPGPFGLPPSTDEQKAAGKAGKVVSKDPRKKPADPRNPTGASISATSFAPPGASLDSYGTPNYQQVDYSSAPSFGNSGAIGFSSSGILPTPMSTVLLPLPPQQQPGYSQSGQLATPCDPRSARDPRMNSKMTSSLSSTALNSINGNIGDAGMSFTSSSGNRMDYVDGPHQQQSQQHQQALFINSSPPFHGSVVSMQQQHQLHGLHPLPHLNMPPMQSSSNNGLLPSPGGGLQPNHHYGSPFIPHLSPNSNPTMPPSSLPPLNMMNQPPPGFTPRMLPMQGFQAPPNHFAPALGNNNVPPPGMSSLRHLAAIPMSPVGSQSAGSAPMLHSAASAGSGRSGPIPPPSHSSFNSPPPGMIPGGFSSQPLPLSSDTRPPILAAVSSSSIPSSSSTQSALSPPSTAGTGLSHSGGGGGWMPQLGSSSFSNSPSMMGMSLSTFDPNHASVSRSGGAETSNATIPATGGNFFQSSKSSAVSHSNFPISNRQPSSTAFTGSISNGNMDRDERIGSSDISTALAPERSPLQGTSPLPPSSPMHSPNPSYVPTLKSVMGSQALLNGPVLEPNGARYGDPRQSKRRYPSLSGGNAEMEGDNINAGNDSGRLVYPNPAKRMRTPPLPSDASSAMSSAEILRELSSVTTDCQASPNEDADIASPPGRSRIGRSGRNDISPSADFDGFEPSPLDESHLPAATVNSNLTSVAVSNSSGGDDSGQASASLPSYLAAAVGGRPYFSESQISRTHVASVAPTVVSSNLNIRIKKKSTAMIES